MPTYPGTPQRSGLPLWSPVSFWRQCLLTLQRPRVSKALAVFPHQRGMEVFPFSGRLASRHGAQRASPVRHSSVRQGTHTRLGHLSQRKSSLVPPLRRGPTVTRKTGSPGLVMVSPTGLHRQPSGPGTFLLTSDEFTSVTPPSPFFAHYHVNTAHRDL